MAEYKKPLNVLFEEMAGKIDLLTQMKETAGVAFERLTAKLSDKGDGTLEDIEDPVIKDIMCQINLDEVHLSMLTEVLINLAEIVKRASCMLKEGE